MRVGNSSQQVGRKQQKMLPPKVNEERCSRRATSYRIRGGERASEMTEKLLSHLGNYNEKLDDLSYSSFREEETKLLSTREGSL